LPNPTDHDPIAFPGRPRREADAGAAAVLALPLDWEAVERPPSPDLLYAAEQSDAAVLRLLLQGIELEARTRPADEAMAEAIAPLCIKLDMVMGLLARLAYRDVELPPRRPVELRSGRIVFADAQQRARTGDWLRILIYFDPVLRDPVVLFGRVVGGGDGSRIVADLVGVSERLEADLMRLAYLAHRRQRAAEPPRRGT
jgi:hypothetical protein